MLGDHARDLLGFAFFSFVALVSGAAAWEHPTILACLYTLHNLLLAGFYCCRKPVRHYDRCGLWLGLIAALLPALSTADSAPWTILIPGLAGYGLCLWALVTLGPRFGIAPADRGLTTQGPYRWVRHPMYLGELLFRLSLVLMSRNILLDLLLAMLLISVQIWRLLREETRINGYGCYARLVRWRLVPGVW
jgi:protein-S-isoprenylcysteine O-methyltransferase Ste14